MVFISDTSEAIDILREELLYVHELFSVEIQGENCFCAIGAVADVVGRRKFEAPNGWGVAQDLRKQLRNPEALCGLRLLCDSRATVSRKQAISILRSFITDLRRK